MDPAALRIQAAAYVNHNHDRCLLMARAIGVIKSGRFLTKSEVGVPGLTVRFSGLGIPTVDYPSTRSAGLLSFVREELKPNQWETPIVSRAPLFSPVSHRIRR